MGEGRIIALRDLRQPDPDQTESSPRTGELISFGPGWAEVKLSDGGAPVPAGTPVELQTSETMYLGQVESREIQEGVQRLRVRVDHFLALQDISSIQKRWTQEQPD